MNSNVRCRPVLSPSGAIHLLLLLSMGLVLAAACGKKGPPLPPLRKGPERVSSLSVRQRGTQIVVAGQLPDKNQDGGPMAPIQEVRIFRLDRPLLSAGMGASARSAQRSSLRQFTREAKRIAALSGESLGKAISGRRVTFIDPQPAEGAVSDQGKELAYAMTVVDADKHVSSLSPLISLKLMPPPLPPSLLRTEVSEKKVRISWEPPASEGKDEMVLYNLYRGEETGGFQETPRNEQPLPQPLFEDEDFSFGKTYSYVARTVIVEKNSTRESENSLPVKVSPVDAYPPAAPTGLAVSAESGVIKLYWFPNSETDLGGYRIYRSTQEGEGFEMIGSAGSADSTYVDGTAKPGVKYYYAATAVDQATPANESARSEVHGDRLPQVRPPSVQSPARRP